MSKSKVEKSFPIGCVTLVPYLCSGFFVGLECAKGRGVILPGGHWEKGETYHSAAARELMEETGIQVSPEELKHLWTGPAGNGAMCVSFLAPPLRVKPPDFTSSEGRIVVADWRDFFRSSFVAYYRVIHDIYQAQQPRYDIAMARKVDTRDAGG